MKKKKVYFETEQFEKDIIEYLGTTGHVTNTSVNHYAKVERSTFKITSIHPDWNNFNVFYA